MRTLLGVLKKSILCMVGQGSPGCSRKTYRERHQTPSIHSELVEGRSGRFPVDPRYFQIMVLSSLLIFAVLKLDISIEPAQVVCIVISAQATQFLFSKVSGLARFEPKAALISSLSLSLLLRTDSLWLAALASLLAIGSKFTIRFDGKHIFNPSAFALVVLLLWGDGVSVSPGQWGNTPLFALAVAGLAGIVLGKSRSADISLAFIGFYSGLLVIRTWWLGDPMTIPLHQIQNGAFLLFCFFMISDPKTIPDSRRGRLVFAGCVALIALYLRFYQYNPYALLYALVFSAPLTLLLDRIFPARRYQWL